jgi:hypothetical protein
MLPELLVDSPTAKQLRASLSDDVPAAACAGLS